MTAVGTTLYGVCQQGGTSNFGTVFRINVDGTGFAILHSFTGAPADGKSPYGPLVAVGSTLYGTTFEGGALSSGTAFRINTDGTDFAIVRSFDQCVDPTAASEPKGGLALSGGAFYGLSNGGCGQNLGSVFKLDVTCDANQRAADGACVACAAGSTAAAGANPLAGIDTTCTPTACAVDQFVSSHVCTACAPGSKRAAGDLATGADTSCTGTVCASNQYVSNHVCTACPAGTSRAAGDLATGADTSCASNCPANQYVSNHTCTPCALGSTRPAGDSVTGVDTTCTATACAANEHVVSHACVACAPGSTRSGGDLATGPDTSCAPSPPTVPPLTDAGGDSSTPEPSPREAAATEDGCTIARTPARSSTGAIAAFVALVLLGLRRCDRRIARKKI